ncbi:competence type IV pilus assembly protein ComGB [Staphylococcus americanisciuri]|nr:competence type IV pilus assembly protein ComGB [Staphylococcus americanisciuri]
MKSRKALACIKANHLLIIDRTNQLIKHGFTFLEAITFVYEQLNITDTRFNDKFSETLQKGASCYEIFKLLRYPQTILMQLYFAEKYSELSATLTQCYTYYEKHKALKLQFIKAVQYPITLLIIFLLLVMTLNATVLPEFEHMYATMDVQGSFLQTFLKAFITNFPLVFLTSSLISLFSIYLFQRWLNKQPMQKQIYILTHIPIFKRYFRLFITYQMSQQFVLFFKNGIKLNDIVQIYLQQDENLFLNYIGETLKSEIQKGERFSDILMNLNCFEQNFITYIEQGEKRDKLDIELIVYSNFIMDHIQSFIQRHIKLIQPIMFAVIGLLIMSVYLVMMLPVFEMMQTIQQ